MHRLSILTSHRTISRHLFLGSSVRTSSSDTFDPKSRREVTQEMKPGDRTLTTPTEEKKVFKPSFGKQLFLGKFDTSVLTFPEVLEKEEHETLHELLGPIEKFFNEQVDSQKIDRDGKIPEDVMQGLKELGVFGLQIPTEYGGLGLNSTGFARVCEILAQDGGIAVTLAAHQSIGLKGLLLYGTEQQKKKYLPRLASGELVAAFCLTEPTAGSDAASVKCKARLSPDGTHWLLTGSKVWISNGGIADFFTVFANSADDSVSLKVPNRLTAFAVERGFGGVTSGKPEDKLGIRGSNTCEVHFENTPVPIENVIGEVGGGFKVAVNILNSGRFSMGSSGAGGLRRGMAQVVQYAIERKQFGKSLSEFGLIKEKISRLALSTYTMESMAYLTAGMIDSGEYEDCAVEAAMVKVYSSEASWQGSSECLQILGGLGYMKDFPYERALRDSRILSIFEGTNEILRLFIALMGVQYAGKGLRELVKKLRNPFQHPGLALQTITQRWRNEKGVPKLTLKLAGYLHPSLQVSAQQLEYSVHRFQYAVQDVLQKVGADVVEHQLILRRLADISIDIFAMTAVLSRASRAYCTGIRNAQLEMLMAEVICQEADARIRMNIQELLDGKFITTDERLMDISKVMFENKGYCVEHPLTRNIW